MDTWEHIKGCKEMLEEVAEEVNLKVFLKTYDQPKLNGKFLKITEILLLDENDNFVYRSYDNVSTILGFIDGIQSSYRTNKT